MDLLKPNTAQRVEQKQQKQKDRHDAKSKSRTFDPGDWVYVKNYLRGDKWLPGVIVENITSQMFKVQMSGGRVRRCHLNQLRKRDSVVPEVPDIPIPRPPEVPKASRDSHAREQPAVGPPEPPETTNTTPDSVVKAYPLRRNPKPVERYEPTWT